MEIKKPSRRRRHRPEEFKQAVIEACCVAKPHHAYLFANQRGNRLKVLVHDGHGIWLANRRLNQGRFQLRPGDGSVALTRGQFAALILGLPWERLADGGVIRVL